MRSLVCLIVVFFLASTIPQSAVGQEDYRVLPIKSQLDVSLVFIDVDPTLFGARTVDEILRLVSNNVRKTAKAVLHRSEPYEYAPFEFEVRLSGREFRLVPLEEFRLLLRSLNNPTPRELLEKEGVSGSLSSIHAPSALKMLVDLTRKHAPDILKNHVIFFICGARALGSTPIYHTFGQIPETRKYGGELLINMYGGPWWGRYVFVDLCAPTGYREYRPIQNLNTASERLAMLVNYVDELIDLQFVKSTLYYPRYRLQLFVDIVVVDATKLGLNFNQLVQSFDIETVEQALITLTPYNLYTFKVRLFKANEIPGFTGIIRIDQGKNLALFEAYKAYDLLKRSGKLFEESADYVYVPAIVVVTDYNTRVYLESDPDGDGFLGIALPNPENPRLGEVAVAGASYYSLFYEGLAATVVHEIAHVLGLSHPHDDFDEEAGDEVYGRMIYTDGIETFMSYSTTWVEAIKRRTIRENFYPIKTYWSVFDLDAIDRAVISLLLSSYEENYQQIINRLGQAGLRLADLQNLNNALTLAKQYAKTSVQLFKNHTYLNRLDYKGLGAQLESSFDYAFMAMALTELAKTYVEGLIKQNERLRPQLEALRTDIERLTQALNSIRRENERAAADLRNVEEAVKRASDTNEALKKRLRELSEEAAQLEQLQSKKNELEKRFSEVRRSLDALEWEAGVLRNAGTLLMVLIFALAAMAAVIVFRLRRVM